MLKTFYDMCRFSRGEWAYGVGRDEFYFGSIQGLDLSKKCVLYGISTGISKELVWLPEWQITTNPDDFIKIAEKDGKEKLAKEFVNETESKDWVKSVREIEKKSKTESKDWMEILSEMGVEKK